MISISSIFIIVGSLSAAYVHYHWLLLCQLLSSPELFILNICLLGVECKLERLLKIDICIAYQMKKWDFFQKRIVYYLASFLVFTIVDSVGSVTTVRLSLLTRTI